MIDAENNVHEKYIPSHIFMLLTILEMRKKNVLITCKFLAGLLSFISFME